MKSLIITAQPSLQGFTHEIANQYAGTKKTKGYEVELINLYEEKYKQPFLEFETLKEIPQDMVRNLFQEKITKADELVFIFPIWWGDAPAILKNWLDMNFTAKFAFEYEKGRPKGLLKGKTAKVIVTSGAPKILYWWFGYPYKKIWKTNVLEFCGIKVTKTLHFGGADTMSRKKKDKILQKITKLGLQ